MNSVILAYKNRTETMMSCMIRIRRAAKVPPDTAITYAGRLDPMAEGLIIFLCGDMRLLKDRFLHLSKTYKARFFLGYCTDTYDLLGIPRAFADAQTVLSKEVSLETIHAFRPVGTFDQVFPKFSSRRVLGKPLFHHALHGTPVPEQTHMVSIQSYGPLTKESVLSAELLKSITQDIKKVDGQFRQSESIIAWNTIAKTFPKETIEYSITITCSAGFYVRQWVHDLGLFLSTGAVTSGIIRDTIGVFTMSMLNGESYRVFTHADPEIRDLTR